MQEIRRFAFYTWKDVERWLMLNKYKWEKEIIDIEVYLSEIVVIVDSVCNCEKARKILEEVLGDISDGRLYLELDGSGMEITYEEGERGEKKDITTPLFRKILYQDTAYAKEMLSENLPGVPVIAFHSYKGGVGRTLAVLAFAKAWSAQKPEEKLLIVDSDIEAPGLSWLWGIKEETAFSYLDLMDVIQSYGTAKEAADLAAAKIRTMTIPVQTELMMGEHFFLPTYRYDEQLLDIYSSPESIASSYNRKYQIAETLSEIGKRLGVKAVLIDLRAGISEFSAPVLFDPRVKKYIASSTSYQSVKGTEFLLEQLLKGLPVTADIKVPEILLTMVMDNINTGDIVSDLTVIYDQNSMEEALTDNLVTELPFASELVHLGSLSQIMQCLEGREFYKKIYNIAKDSYTGSHEVNQTDFKNRREIIRDIHKMAENQINAEGNVKFNVLLTQPISNLLKRFEDTIPTTVIMGTKGSGKTFLYREILKSQYWEVFVAGLAKKKCTQNNIMIVPLLSARNAGDFQPAIETCIKNYNSVLKKSFAVSSFCMDNEREVKKYARDEHDSIEWLEFWKQLFLPKGYENLMQFDRELGGSGKKIVYVIDGLEEILTQTLTRTGEKNAVLALCQDFINEIRINYKNIGCILFLRKDLARNSIEVNFEQFNTLYKGVELSWSKTEALRLALWLVNQAAPGFYDAMVSIETASQDVIEGCLVRLWGKKLGRAGSNEAYSSRWILAALSDFNGQLQARDIIRFLQNATEEAGKDAYDDRYIMPTEIKKAVPKCSLEKISEIKQEIGALKPVLEKLEKSSPEKKRLPFHSDTFNLSAKEELMLKQEGYLRIENDKYYLPEIIRHALEFKYEKGARPKVLSLLLNK